MPSLSVKATCPRCGSEKTRRSRYQNWPERLRGFLGRQPRRCRDCRLRFWVGGVGANRVVAVSLAVLLVMVAVVVVLRTQRVTPPAPAPDASIPAAPAVGLDAEAGRGVVSTPQFRVSELLSTLATSTNASPDQAEADIPAVPGEDPNLPKAPNVSGMHLVRAISILERMRIPYQVVLHGPVYTQPPRWVFDQGPRPGRAMYPGYPIVLNVFENPLGRLPGWWRGVPAVQSSPIEIARETLLKEGLSARVDYVPTAEPLMDGVVREQLAGPGSMVPFDTPIVLLVNRYQEMDAERP